ncbi:MAG: thiol:disulfide interchange protein DsbA/DsbL [Gammaproteobacteria bacterium]
MMKKLISVLLMWLCVPAVYAANDATMQVQELAYVEGKQYLAIDPKILDKALKDPTVKALLDSASKDEKGNKSHKVAVWLFFNYGCPICNAFEPKVSQWYNEKKDQHLIAFTDIPVAWTHPGWQDYARAFYIEESLGVLEKGHHELFVAIHGNGSDIPAQDLTSKEKMREFFHKELGVKPEDFDSHYDTFEIRMHMKQGDMIGQAYNIRAIPSFVIAGKYYADIQTAGGMEQLIGVVNFLVNKESFTKDQEKIDFNAVSEGTTK